MSGLWISSNHSGKHKQLLQRQLDKDVCAMCSSSNKEKKWVRCLCVWRNREPWKMFWYLCRRAWQHLLWSPVCVMGHFFVRDKAVIHMGWREQMKVFSGLEGSFNRGKALGILELLNSKGKGWSSAVQSAQQRARAGGGSAVLGGSTAQSRTPHQRLSSAWHHCQAKTQVHSGLLTHHDLVRQQR